MLEAIVQHGMLARGDTVLIAVSGGVDSVALLLILSALRAQLGVKLVVAHFDHGIRGAASRADAAYVEALAAEMGLACVSGAGDVPALARQRRVSLEEAARDARYAFLDMAAAEAGAQRIALAHQMEDQAETVLLHLVHGAGLEGLGGMLPVQGNRIRPLLGVSRASLEAYARAAGVAWREDVTNTDAAHTRNFLRMEVFARLRRINPRAAEAMARTADICARASRTLAEQARAAQAGRIKRIAYGAFWDLPEAEPDHTGVRVFAAWAGVAPLDARQTDAVVALRAGAYANLPGGWRALRTRARLHLLSPAPGRAEIPPDALVWEAPVDASMGDGIRRQRFDADRIAGAALRFRRPGDVFAPLGGGGTQKLKQTLRDAGIDQPMRDLTPVLAKGERVLWIVGVKPSADAAVTEDTRRTVMGIYRGELPWEVHTKQPGLPDGGDRR